LKAPHAASCVDLWYQTSVASALRRRRRLRGRSCSCVGVHCTALCDDESPSPRSAITMVKGYHDRITCITYRSGP
jgi:hypothetical protein